MRLSAWSLTSLFLLSACSAYAPPANLAGVTESQLVSRMGQPETRRQIAGETRLEFPTGPYGKHTWFVYLDAAGNAIRSEQVLTEKNFNLIVPGMDQAQVRMRLGRPGEVQPLGAFAWRGVALPVRGSVLPVVPGGNRLGSEGALGRLW